MSLSDHVFPIDYWEIGYRVVDPQLEIRGEIVNILPEQFGDRVLVKYDDVDAPRWTLVEDLLLEEDYDWLENDDDWEDSE
jgi:hypothetical protein